MAKKSEISLSLLFCPCFSSPQRRKVSFECSCLQVLMAFFLCLVDIYFHCLLNLVSNNLNRVSKVYEDTRVLITLSAIWIQFSVSPLILFPFFPVLGVHNMLYFWQNLLLGLKDLYKGFVEYRSFEILPIGHFWTFINDLDITMPPSWLVHAVFLCWSLNLLMFFKFSVIINTKMLMTSVSNHSKDLYGDCASWLLSQSLGKYC